MAHIPQYVSKRQATTEAPAVMQRSEKLAGTVDPGQFENKVAQQASKDLIELGEKMIKVENANDKAKAEIMHTQGELSFAEEVKKDPTKFKDYDNYMQQLDEVASKNFRNNFAKQEYKQEIGLKNVIFKNKLQGEVYKQEVDAGRANTLTQMDLQSSSYINAETEADKLFARQQIENTMAEAVKNKLFSHEQGIDEVNKVIKSADDAVKDRQQLQRRKEKELALAQKEAKSIREQDFIKMRVNGKDNNGVPISREELIKMARFDMNAGAIEPKFAEIYINALKSPKVVGHKTENAKFVGFVNDMLFNKTKPKDITVALMEANTAGSLSDEDFNTLITFNQDVNASAKLNQMLPNVSFLKGAMYWGDENAGARDESKVRIFNDYKTQLQQGINPEIASKQAVKNEVLFLFPQAKTAPKEGIDIMDLNGVIKHITPDGELTIKEKKAKNV